MALISCQTTTETDSGPLRYGQTLYLDGYGPNPSRTASSASDGPLVAPAPVKDDVSYWNGDGIAGTPSIEIDLSDQKAYFYKDEMLVGVSKVSTGRDGYNTPTGTFRVSQKNERHRSNLYGNYVDETGNTVVEDVDVRKDSRPAGTTFEGARMPYFMRFNGGVGMHSGYVPDYPASHGCVRLPGWMAAIFYEHASEGTTVTVKP